MNKKKSENHEKKESVDFNLFSRYLFDLSGNPKIDLILVLIRAPSFAV